MEKEKVLKELLKGKEDIDFELFSDNAEIEVEKEGVQRSIELTKDSDGKMEANSAKLYNFRFNIRKYILGISVGVASTAVAVCSENAIGSIISFGRLLQTTMQTATIKFNEQDAKVLYAIYQNESTRFTTQQLYDNHQELLGSFPVNNVRDSLLKLYEMNSVRRKEGGVFMKRENISFKMKIA